MLLYTTFISTPLELHSLHKTSLHCTSWAGTAAYSSVRGRSQVGEEMCNGGEEPGRGGREECRRYTTLHVTTLHYTTIYTTLYTSLYYTTLHCTTLHYTTLHYTLHYRLHYTTLHHITLHYTTPHYTTLHFTT